MSTCCRLPDDLVKRINESEVLEFALGVAVRTLTRHSSIVLIFDDTPRFSIDFTEYNPTRSKFVSVCNRVSIVFQLAFPRTEPGLDGVLRLHPFNKEDKIDTSVKLLRHVIARQRNKQRAKDLILTILQLNVGKYHAKYNSCRHFAWKVYHLLKEDPKCSKDNQNKFKQRMRKLEKDDSKILTKIMKVSKITVGTIVGISAVASGVATAIASLLTHQVQKHVNEGIFSYFLSES